MKQEKKLLALFIRRMLFLLITLKENILETFNKLSWSSISKNTIKGENTPSCHAIFLSAVLLVMQ